MLGYFCKACRLYFRELDLLPKKQCPECRGNVEPRLILCGQVMGADEQPAKPDWDLVRRACDAVYQGTLAEFLKAEK